MNYQNVGTFDAGVISGQSNANNASFSNIMLSDSGIASGQAFLMSELEKRDPMLRTPLTSFTYPRDININTGGGWVDYVSAMSVGYGTTGGSGDGAVTAGGANGIPIVQANVEKGLYKAHAFSLALRIMFIDMQKSNFIGRSLDQMLNDGVRLSYDKHMDENVYQGMTTYGTTGLVNNADAVETTVEDGASNTTLWKDKTPDEILYDINTALTATWAAAEYDETAMPNHIIIPYEQYTDIMTRKVTDLATETIMDFVLKNNVATKNGQSLFIGGTKWCKGAGVNDDDRMVVYVNHDRFIKVDELVPLSRVMSQPNATNFCYDTTYAANISEVQIMYPQCITYWDGI